MKEGTLDNFEKPKQKEMSQDLILQVFLSFTVLIQEYLMRELNSSKLLNYGFTLSLLSYCGNIILLFILMLRDTNYYTELKWLKKT